MLSPAMVRSWRAPMRGIATMISSIRCFRVRKGSSLIAPRTGQFRIVAPSFAGSSSRNPTSSYSSAPLSQISRAIESPVLPAPMIATRRFFD